MNWNSVIVLCLAVIVVDCQCESAEMRSITGSRDILAVYVEDHQYLAAPPRLVVAVWPDGLVVWSENRTAGGAPYRSGQVSPNRVAAVLAQMKVDGIFGRRELERPIRTPHPVYTTIVLKANGRQLVMRSEHELLEKDGKWTATHNGKKWHLDSPRLDVLAGEPAEFIYFRMVWAETRMRISALIPGSSDPQEGEISLRGGDVSWKGR